MPQETITVQPEHIAHLRVSQESQLEELLKALTHAVEIAEAKREGSWDDLLQYRAILTTGPAQRQSHVQHAQKVPGMAVQALAGEIVQALEADHIIGGYDLQAGLFGPEFSKLVRRWAAAEWAAPVVPQPQDLQLQQVKFGSKAGLYTVRFLNNWDGEGDQEYVVAQLSDEGVWTRHENGSLLFEYVGDAIISAWPLFESPYPAQALPVQDHVGNWIWSWLMDWCKSKGLAPASQDSLFVMVKDARSKFEALSDQISNDKQDQQPIPKALHLEASQISAFLYAGAIECDLDRWDGHVGFVANCAEVALDIAGFLKENDGTENPGVIAYELFEPFGKWMAQEGHLAQNSLLDEFKAHYHAWIKQGQASIPRELAS